MSLSFIFPYPPEDEKKKKMMTRVKMKTSMMMAMTTTMMDITMTAHYDDDARAGRPTTHAQKQGGYESGGGASKRHPRQDERHIPGTCYLIIPLRLHSHCMIEGTTGYLALVPLQQNHPTLISCHSMVGVLLFRPYGVSDVLTF